MFYLPGQNACVRERTSSLLVWLKTASLSSEWEDLIPRILVREYQYLTMYTKVLLSFLFIVGSYWSCNATDLTDNHYTGLSEIVSGLQSYEEIPSEVSKLENLCTLCEKFVSEVVSVLSENKTQVEIVSILHEACTKLPTLEKQCAVFVDYYVPLFFSEISLTEPEDLCQKFEHCKKGIPFKHISKNTCDLCHEVASDALQKLKDPDTELDVVELLLKACESIGKSVKKCKRLVLEYSPIILVNVEHFLETNDVCIILCACNSTSIGDEEF